MFKWTIVLPESSSYFIHLNEFWLFFFLYSENFTSTNRRTLELIVSVKLARRNKRKIHCYYSVCRYVLVTPVKPFPYGPSSRTRARKSHHAFPSARVVRAKFEITSIRLIADLGARTAYVLFYHIICISHFHWVLHGSLSNITVSSTIFTYELLCIRILYCNPRLNSALNDARRDRHASVFIYGTGQLMFTRVMSYVNMSL